MTPKRSESEADALRGFLQQVGSYTQDLIFGIPAGTYLFHYTDLAGLQGIIANKDLWLTDSRYSNDSEEMRHGYKVAETVIKDLEAKGGDPQWLEYLGKVRALLGKPPVEAVYITCFCLEGNLLSQWRGYAASGSGVSLEFDPPQFSYITGDDSPSRGLMRLWKVFYGEPQQKGIMEHAINFGYQRAGSLDEKAKYASEAIFFFVPTFKHSDFHQENECRLIFTPPPDCKVPPKFRVGRGMLIPYYSVSSLTEGNFKLPIKRIVVGPSPLREMNAASVKAMLAAHGYEGIAVESSNTPFRA